MQAARIYYLNKSWDAAGFGHAAVMLPGAAESYVYYSFFAARRFVPLCKGALLVKEFASAAEGLIYAKSEGYTREMHWAMDAGKAAAAGGGVGGICDGNALGTLGMAAELLECGEGGTGGGGGGDDVRVVAESNFRKK